jgi:4-hydroxybenzoate polyprenyltransferase
MLGRVRSLLELIRFSHTIFALPFALSSAALAWQRKDEPFDLLDLLGILLCMIFARSAAMAFNRIADRRLDAANPRTAVRHLPSGRLTLPVVWLFTLACSAGFVASTLLFILTSNNLWPLWLSGPVLIFIFAYSFTKRFTSLAHFWLGASLLLAPLSAWIALLGPVDLATPIVLGLAVMFWVAGFDILYACQDVNFDRKAKLRSVPAALGVATSLRVALLCHLIMMALLVALYFVAQSHLGIIYLVGVALAALLVGYEHSLVRPDDLSRVNKAFFQVNAVISVGLFLVVLLQLAVGV